MGEEFAAADDGEVCFAFRYPSYGVGCLGNPLVRLPQRPGQQVHQLLCLTPSWVSVRLWTPLTCREAWLTCGMETPQEGGDLSGFSLFAGVDLESGRRIRFSNRLRDASEMEGDVEKRG